MAKNYSKLKKTLISSLCAVAVTCTGLAAACNNSGSGDDDKKKTPFEKRTDTQIIKNGDFEYFDFPADEDVAEGKAAYLIKTPDSWTRGGDTSGVMNGIIGTTEEQWNAITDAELSRKLVSNAELSSSDDDYVNYNGMRQRDLLFKDTYAALLGNDNLSSSHIKDRTYAGYFGIEKSGDGFVMNGKPVYISDNATNADKEGDGWKEHEFYFDEALTQPVRKEFTSNPGTHYNIKKTDAGEYYFGEGSDRQTLKKDEKTGDLYYTNSDKEDIYVSNVLMIHNYDNDITSSGNTNNSDFNGIHQYYTSNSVTLEANTAAEISVWVKTSDLKFDKGYSQLDQQDRGAYIEVTQSVGGTSIDSFKIKAINTEKIIANDPALDANNGWLQYTVYVNACDFASSEISIRLGLGQEENSEKIAGYAFFDDVKVTKHLNLNETTYSDHAAEITGHDAACSLTDEGDDKVFIADKVMKSGKNDLRYSDQFRYLIDLASEKGENTYDPYSFDADNTKAGLTTYKNGSKYYVSSDGDDANLTGIAKNIGIKDISDLNPTLVRNKDSYPTQNDLLGVFGADKTFTAADFGNKTDYSTILNDALTGENSFSNLPKYNAQSNMIVMLSSWGAAYTSTISDTSFTLGSKESVALSFWVKTYDMNGKTAATVKVYDKNDNDISQSLSIDTTGKTTDIGDSKDIYKGWVQYFVFVTNDDEEDRTFNIDFSFGNTEITADTQYHGGWVALSNLQTLGVDDDVYELASTGDNLAKLQFTKDDDKKSGNEFASASGTSNIKDGISNLSGYGGYNGGSSAVSDNDFKPVFDAKNTNSLAGLINRDYAENYGDVWNTIAQAFGSPYTEATTNWGKVFGDNCYQPLVIINNLRAYADEATATETTYSDYYVVAEDGFTGDVVTVNGVNYKKADAWDEDETYYSLKDVCNYGFVGSVQTINTDSYTSVSVRVRVSGEATAYVYLIGEDREILSYSAPAVSYWYDEEGNVLDEELDGDWKEKEHREHIVYKLRNDGLYDGTDGKLYANLHNLTKSYKYYGYDLDKVAFYDANGVKVEYDELVEGETYYSDTAASVKAPHFLVNSEGRRLYEYKDGAYYYIVKGETSNKKVENFSEEYKRNYTAFESGEGDYAVKVENTNGEWVTVNFILHVSSVEQKYRLELWSGERNLTGVEVAGNGAASYKEGAVAFDYCSYSVTQNEFDNLRSFYEGEIKKAYNTLLKNEGLLDKVQSNDENLAYYEELVSGLVESGDLSAADVNAIKDGYAAKYYTYSLYDSANYVPFNGEAAADGETGYEYTITNYNEALAFFKYDEYENGKLLSHNIFADYSVVDQNINLGTVDDGDDDNKDDGNSENNFGNLMLYVSSIILVIVLLLTLVLLIIRDAVKKHRRKKGAKQYAKNNYRQRQRYIRKLNLATTVDENEAAAEGENAEEASVEEIPAEEANEEVTPEDAPAEEVPAEETPAEEPVDEAPATEENPEDKPE